MKFWKISYYVMQGKYHQEFIPRRLEKCFGYHQMPSIAIDTFKTTNVDVFTYEIDLIESSVPWKS